MNNTNLPTYEEATGSNYHSDNKKPNNSINDSDLCVTKWCKCFVSCIFLWPILLILIFLPYIIPVLSLTFGTSDACHRCYYIVENDYDYICANKEVAGINEKEFLQIVGIGDIIVLTVTMIVSIATYNKVACITNIKNNKTCKEIIALFKYVMCIVSFIISIIATVIISKNDNFCNSITYHRLDYGINPIRGLTIANIIIHCIIAISGLCDMFDN